MSYESNIEFKFRMLNPQSFQFHEIKITSIYETTWWFLTRVWHVFCDLIFCSCLLAEKLISLYFVYFFLTHVNYWRPKIKFGHLMVPMVAKDAWVFKIEILSRRESLNSPYVCLGPSSVRKVRSIMLVAEGRQLLYGFPNLSDDDYLCTRAVLTHYTEY